MEHNDLVIADIGGQAIGILLHCTESAQKNINVKAYTHSHIYSHIQRELDNTKTENSPNLVWKYTTVLPTGSKKSSVWPPLASLTSSGFSPAVHPRYLLRKTVLKEVFYFLCKLWLTPSSCVGPQNKIGHPAGCSIPC